MQSVPFDAVLHFDLHAAILGWLLTAPQPKLQHPWHTAKVRLQLETVIVSIIGRQSFAEVDRQTTFRGQRLRGYDGRPREGF
jgi:hypothetical protein